MDLDSAESATQLLHRLTTYTVDWDWDQRADDPRIRHDVVPNDAERHSWLVKRYDRELPRTALPRELPVNDSPALAVLGGTVSPGPAPLDLAALSRVLHLSAGVVRTTERPLGTHLFRAAGSAGGRFPLELYVSIPSGSADLPAGVHWYDPVDHALVQVGPEPRADEATQGTTIVVTGVPWRTGWRYVERGFRHVYWDAGTMLAQLLSLSESGGHAPRLYTTFPDAAVTELVGADGVHEWPVALVTFGESSPSLAAAGPAVTGRIDADPVEFPLVTAAQRGGDGEELGSAWPVGAAVDVGSGDITLDQVIVKRGSQRRMNPDRGLPVETLRICMTVALRGIGIEHWIAVHDVTGVAPGVYHWPALETPVTSASTAEMRAELYRVCLDQALARDAAFVVIAATDVSRLSDREYRDAQLAAGIAEGRLHLAAYALGAGATGMTFLDSEIPALLGERASAAAAALDASGEIPPPHGLLFTCVGVADNTSKPAGAPGAPTPVRLVEMRE